jgi:flagellin-specific chaperone FliS|tara:strand:+ start:3053 stop:3232 length:180 start_codon:yes stop_codon:yes gene_type:complete
MDNYSKEFLEKTINVWQRYYHSPLNLEDAQEIADNMIGLFSLVSEIEQEGRSIGFEEMN